MSTAANPLANLQTGNPYIDADMSLPDAPKPNMQSESRFVQPAYPVAQHGGNLNKFLALGDLATRGLDAYSTLRALKNPANKEDVLPSSLAHSSWGMPAYSGGVALGNYLLSHELEKHGHPLLSHLVPMTDIAIDLPPAINNLFLPTAHQNTGKIRLGRQ